MLVLFFFVGQTRLQKYLTGFVLFTTKLLRVSHSDKALMLKMRQIEFSTLTAGLCAEGFRLTRLVGPVEMPTRWMCIISRAILKTSAAIDKDMDKMCDIRQGQTRMENSRVPHNCITGATSRLLPPPDGTELLTSPWQAFGVLVWSCSIQDERRKESLLRPHKAKSQWQPAMGPTTKVLYVSGLLLRNPR